MQYLIAKEAIPKTDIKSNNIIRKGCGDTERKDISKATLGRIPIYLKYVKNLPPEIQTVSSTVIAKDLGFGEVQVRKDLSLLDSIGKPKIGYLREELIESLERFLGTQNGNAVVVGAGKLGTALLSYDGFSEYGCNVLAAFDRDINSPHGTNNGKTVYPISELAAFCKEKNVQIGIIAVPSESAQTVLNQLCSAGIKYIWCFAPCRLYKPADVTIQYENLALSLAHLKSQITL